MKTTEIKEMGAEELAQKIRETTAEYATLRMKHKSGAGVEKPVRLRTMHREIARMKTIQAQREAK